MPRNATASPLLVQIGLGAVGFLAVYLGLKGLIPRITETYSKLGAIEEQLRERQSDLQRLTTLTEQAQESVQAFQNSDLGRVSRVVSVLKASPNIESLAAEVAAMKGAPVFFNVSAGDKNAPHDKEVPIGPHRFCALSANRNSHASQSCICVVRHKDTGWHLEVGVDESRKGTCACTAVCLD